jgi:hypothetical protein
MYFLISLAGTLPLVSAIAVCLLKIVIDSEDKDGFHNLLKRLELAMVSMCIYPQQESKTNAGQIFW